MSPTRFSRFLSSLKFSRFKTRKATPSDMPALYNLLNDYVLEQNLKEEFTNSKRAPRMNIPDVKSARVFHDATEDFVGDFRTSSMNELKLNKNDVVLVVGCATGGACREAAERVQFVTGFDVSPAMIEVAKSCTSTPNIDYHIADAHTFIDHRSRWNHTTFDKAMSFFVLNFCFDSRRVLENIRDCLRPGGRALLTVFLQTRILSPKCSFGDTADEWLRRHPKWGTYFKNFDYHHTHWENKDEFLDLLRQLGLTCTFSLTGPMPFLTQSSHEVKGLIKTLLIHVNEVPEHLKEECVDDIRRWLHDVTPKLHDGHPINPLGEGEIITVIAQRMCSLNENIPRR